MKAMARLFLLNDQNEKFFGEGPYQLLKMVQETGSLHAGAQAMGMAYSKATKLLKNAEKSLGFSLTVRKIGGKDGGGSVLTDEAKDFLHRYEAYRSDCMEYSKKQYNKYFGKKEAGTKKIGCVIMASGLGKRFGGDKLMAELYEKPIIQYVIEATENLFCCRVVVTRNEKVKKWCEELKIPVVYHSMPHRNDTVRIGLEALETSEEKLSGCVFCPADMPFVSKESLIKMLEEAETNSKGIIRMAYGDNVGSPVLFSKGFFDSLKKLSEGNGGSEIIRENQDKLILVEANEEYELWDIDTKEDYEKVKNKIKEIFL